MRQKWRMEKPFENWNFQVFTFETHQSWREKWYSSTWFGIFKHSLLLLLEMPPRCKCGLSIHDYSKPTKYHFSWHLTIFNNKRKHTVVGFFHSKPTHFQCKLNSNFIMKWINMMPNGLLNTSTGQQKECEQFAFLCYFKLYWNLIAFVMWREREQKDNELELVCDSNKMKWMVFFVQMKLILESKKNWWNFEEKWNSYLLVHKQRIIIEHEIDVSNDSPKCSITVSLKKINKNIETISLTI